MRIISGRFKSREIKFPKTKKTRPVTDRSKETIFNILGDAIRNAVVLDLFAGSGSMGLEALSRGASQVVFVDQGRFATDVIRQNLKILKLDSLAIIYEMPVQRVLRMLQKRGFKFNQIFIDPPYNKGLIKKVLHLIDRFDIVANLGQLIIGRSSKEGLPDDLKRFKLERDQKLGQSYLTFYRLCP